MTTQNNKSTSEKLARQQALGKKSLWIGGIIILIIATTPILFYSYKSFPEGNLWKTSFFALETDYDSWVSTSWYILSKIVPLILLFIWFFTCKHFWHWIILVPISMYIFQLWNILNVSNKLDEVELIYLFPVMAVLVPFVYLIRAKLFNSVRGDSLNDFEQDLTRKRTIWQQVIDLFR